MKYLWLEPREPGTRFVALASADCPHWYLRKDGTWEHVGTEPCEYSSVLPTLKSEGE